MMSVVNILLISILTTCSYAFPKDSPYNELTLFRYFQNQNYQGAVDYLMPYYDQDSLNLDVVNQLAYSYRLANNLTAAMDFYTRSFQIDSMNVGVLSNLGNISMGRFNYHLAEAYFGRILAVDSNHVGAHIALSGLMERKFNAEKAYEHLEHAYNYRSTDMDLAADLIRMCMGQQEYVRADSLLQIVLPKDPDNGRLLYARAEVSNHLERYKEVVTTCEHIIGLGAQNEATLRLYATGLFAVKNYDKCLEQYESLIAMDGNLNELDFYYMAMSAKAMKRYQEGLEYMDMALEAAISPNAGFYYGRKADLFKLANQPSNAIATYQKSFHYSSLPIHYYEMALIFDRDLTNPTQALRHYELFLKQELKASDEPYVKFSNYRIDVLKQ